MVVKWLLYEESNNAPLVRYCILHTPMRGFPQHGALDTCTLAQVS